MEPSRAMHLVTMDNSPGRLEQTASVAANWLIDLVFPPKCSNCGRVDFRFCPACRGDLSAMPVDVWFRFDVGLDGASATGKHSGIMQTAVQSFKYEGATELTTILAARLVAALQALDWPIDFIVPVPLFADRLAERGYNQSDLLSQVVEETMCIPCRPDWLIRARETNQQAGLDAARRVENVKDAFEAAADVARHSILLIDDVVTTGSTLSECAAALREKGASAVYGIAVSQA